MNIPLNIDWQQIVLHLMNFAILSGGLYFLLYAPVKKFMDARQEQYSKLDQEAKDKLENAKAVEIEYKERLNQVDAEIEEKLADASREAEARINASTSKAKEDAAKIISDAKAVAMAERARIIDNTQKEIINMAVEATEKILADNAFDQFLNAAERSTGDAN